MARIVASPEPRHALAAQVEELAVDARLGRELELGQIEVDALPALGLGPAGVEERERRAEHGGVDRGAVHRDVGLDQVDAALAVHEERQLALGDLVLALALDVTEVELALHRGHPVVGRAHGVDQPVTARVLVVVQIAVGALAFRPGVERVDEHGGDRARPRDLDARASAGRPAPAGPSSCRRRRRRGGRGARPGAARARARRPRVEQGLDLRIQPIVERQQVVAERVREERSAPSTVVAEPGISRHGIAWTIGKFATFRMARATAVNGRMPAAFREWSGSDAFAAWARDARPVARSSGAARARQARSTPTLASGRRADHPDVRPLGLLRRRPLFACFPLRDKEHDLWIRLTGGDQPARCASRASAPTGASRRRAGSSSRGGHGPGPSGSLAPPRVRGVGRADEASS